MLRSVIDPTGTVRDIRVVHSLGLDEKAIEAVKKWKFRPGYRNGKPVAAQATIQVSFSLNFRLGRTKRRPTKPTENEKPEETTAPVTLSADQEVQRNDAATTREPITAIEKPEETERAEKPNETESPQRFRNLLIQVVRMPPPEKAYGFGTLSQVLFGEVLPPQPGHYFVAVRARVRNVNEKFCQNRPATISELLPGENTAYSC
ncbi:MAG: hypothetical protein DMG57_32515 [Acidobacteria bacterium]|nr:MAG: hypothetical protein DMG57_32515 [Acidobacteriota bacterium]